MNHLHDSADQESTIYMDGTEYQLQLEGSMSCQHSTLYIEASESAQISRGEACGGVGSDSCDQETRAWNPRFTSMNYALARLARAS
jgi:hypothetical protein